MATLVPQGKQQYTTSTGAPLAGGLVYTYAAGTSTPLATYSNQAGTVPNANPVVLDARGEATIFWGAGPYKVALHDASDVQIWTQDDIYPSAAAVDLIPIAADVSTVTSRLDGSPGTTVGAGLVIATGSTTARSHAARAADVVNVRDFGAIGNGTAIDSAAVQAAINAAGTSAEVYLPPGTYIVCNIELLVGTHISGAGKALTTLKLAPGLTAAQYLTDRSGHTFNGFTVLYNSYPSGGYNGNQPLDGICVRDLTIDGNYSAQTASYNGWGLYLNSVTNARVDNVTVRNCLNHGFTFKESTYGQYSHLLGTSNGHTSNGAGGDGLVLLSRCTDNIVRDCVMSSNASAGFEDEGRNGSYNPLNRNARNRFVNCTAIGNADNAYDALYADAPQLVNFHAYGGSSSVNAAQIQLLGVTDALVDGAHLKDSGKEGIRVWQDVIPMCQSSRVRLRSIVVEGAAGRALVHEGVQGMTADINVRGCGGATVVNGSAVGYNRTGGAVDGTGGYGMGAYSVGVAYTTAAQNGVCGNIVTNAGNIYQLTASLTGTGLSVTAPTGTTTSSDNGGTWTYIGPIGSTDVDLVVNYDGTAPTAYATGQAYTVGIVRSSGGYVYRLDSAFTGTGLSVTAPTGTTTSSDNGGTWVYLYRSNIATYGVYEYNPTRLTIRDSRVIACADHNIWIDGTAYGVTGFRMKGTRSTASGARTVTFTSGALTGANSVIEDSDISGGAMALNLDAEAGQLVVTHATGFVTHNSGVTSAIATGATVAHGLAGTPAQILLTPTDGTPTAVYPSAVNGTNFTINYTGGGTHAFYWSARLAVDP